MVTKVFAVVLSLLCALCALSSLAAAGGPPACAPPAYMPCPPPSCAAPMCGPPSPFSVCGGLLAVCSSICGSCIGLPSAIMGGLLAPPPVFLPPRGCPPPVRCVPAPCSPPAPITKCKPSAALSSDCSVVCAIAPCPAPQPIYGSAGQCGVTYPPVGPGCAALCGNLLEMPVRLVSGVLSVTPMGPFCGATSPSCAPFGTYW